MKFTREQSEGLYTIHAYDEGEVILNSPDKSDDRDENARVTLTHSFIVSPGKLIADWAPLSLNELTGNDLAPLPALSPEVVLLGTGKRMQFPGQEQLAALMELGVGYEVMDSSAACRTYNILAGEGRQVAAAIIVEK